MNTSVIFQIQSACILFLLYIGLTQRKNRKRHVPIMASVIAWDLILILQIELSRGAIAKASKALTNPMILNIHVSLAVTTTLLYIVIIYTGRKLLKGDYAIRPKHKLIGMSVTFFRTATFITSFFVHKS